MSAHVAYRLAAGVEVVPTADGVLLVGATRTLHIGGPSAGVLRDVLESLDGRTPTARLARRHAGVSAESLSAELDGLARVGLVRRGDAAVAVTETEAFAEALGVDVGEVRERLTGCRIAVVGRDAVAAHVVAALGDAGVGDVTRANDDMTVDDVSGLAAGAGLLVCCDTRGDLATAVNRAVLEAGVPALFGAIEPDRAVIGPLVEAGTACWLCWRMRSLAWARDFSHAMAIEEHRAAARVAPQLRAVLPTLAPVAAGLLATEALRWALRLGPPALVERVLVVSPVDLESTAHPVLRRPGCPACRPTSGRRPLPRLGEPGSDAPAGDIDGAAARLCSTVSGICSPVDVVTKGPTEPRLPHLAGAVVGNHSFMPRAHAREVGFATGKGATAADAARGALGEAVERYAATMWRPDEIVCRRRTALDAPAVDPRDLVLYADWQYDSLPYDRYTDSTELGWWPARSVVSGDDAWVPAIAALVGYRPGAGEHLCPTSSNGLAAGATLAEAVAAAALEVVERDAFFRAWLRREPGSRLIALGHRDGVVAAAAAAYARRGIVLELHRLGTDLPVTVTLAVTVDEGASADGGAEPSIVVGLGAAIAGDEADRRAVLEVGQCRSGIRQQLHDPARRARARKLWGDPTLVADLTDHALRYTVPEAPDAFAFLRGVPLEEPPAPDVASADAATTLAALAAALRARGGDLLYADLTPPDVEALGLHVARAVIPGYQPLHVGWGEERLGHPRLGCAAPGSANPDPHPLP